MVLGWLLNALCHGTGSFAVMLYSLVEIDERIRPTVMVVYCRTKSVKSILLKILEALVTLFPQAQECNDNSFCMLKTRMLSRSLFVSLSEGKGVRRSNRVQALYSGHFHMLDRFVCTLHLRYQMIVGAEYETITPLWASFWTTLIICSYNVHDYALCLSLIIAAFQWEVLCN